MIAVNILVEGAATSEFIAVAGNYPIQPRSSHFLGAWAHLIIESDDKTFAVNVFDLRAIGKDSPQFTSGDTSWVLLVRGWIGCVGIVDYSPETAWALAVLRARMPPPYVEIDAEHCSQPEKVQQTIFQLLNLMLDD